MANTIEIRWHGRGGQGAKTAALLLADIAAEAGSFVQGFPEYGPERMGAPITAYNRISDSPVRLHANIYKPDYVVVVDESLLNAIDVTSGLKPDGALIVNSHRNEDEIRAELPGYTGTIHTIDANNIALKYLGKKIPNTPLLAMVVMVTGVITVEEFVKHMKESLEHKFSTKLEVVEGNMKAIEYVLEGEF